MKSGYITILMIFLSLCGFSQIHFFDVADQRGIEHQYGFGAPGGGVSFVDFNQDGLDDITLATAVGELIYFFENTGTGFQKMPPLVDHSEESKHILWVDFDNDEDLDLYVTTHGGANRLYRNNGDLQMEDITQVAGLPINERWHYGAVWGDYDRDGWLDLYFSERKTLTIGTTNRNRLFRNNADGSFTEMTAAANVGDENKFPFCSAFFDYNNDRWPDIYTANDKFYTNTLLRNNGNGTFIDVSVATQSDIAINAMCVTVGDYNNDAQQDIYVTNLPLGNALLKNQVIAGNNFFEEVASEANVGFYASSWGSNFLDANNDGLLDLYVSSNNVGTDTSSSTFYKNENGEIFSEDFMGFVGDTVKSYSNAIGDFNSDGFPDILVSNFSPFNTQLWQNGGGDNNWLKVSLEGVRSNRQGVGAKLEFYTNGQFQMRYTHCGIGYLAQNSNTEIIGLENAMQVDSLVITWPTGHVDKLFEIDANQILYVIEGSTTNGEIEVDSDVTLTAAIPVATTDWTKDQSSFQLYPNPTTGVVEVIFKNKKSETGELVLYNMFGQIEQSIFIEKDQKRVRFNLRNEISGTYLLKYQSEKTFFVEKLLKL